jgi:hypothetical protein
MGILQIQKTQYYRLVGRGVLERCRNGLVRCDWLRAYLQSRGTKGNRVALTH